MSGEPRTHSTFKCTTMIRRSLWAGLLFLGLSTLAFSQGKALQGNTPTVAQSDLYLRAIRIYVDTTYQLYGGIDTTRDWFRRYFESDRGIQDRLPTQIASCRIQWLEKDSSQLQEIKSKKQRIPLTRIWPITNSRDTLVVDFSEYWFSTNGPESHYALAGGCRITFVYDCTKREFVVKSVHLWGV